MIKKMMMLYVAVMAAIGAWAKTETINGIEWTYTVIDGKASVGGDSSPAIPRTTSGAITIPSVIGGYPVTSIGFNAFYYCENLTSVTIPDSVKNIEGYAFSYCRSLVRVTMPDSVTSIGYYAFFYCSSLRSVAIPNQVINIGENAFFGCKDLADSNGFVIVKGLLYNYYGEGSDVIIPNCVMRIGNSAFSGCSSLTCVTIPNSVISIGQNAFSGCNTTLYDRTTIPGVILVDGWAIGYDDSLSGELDLMGIRGISDNAFSGCGSLTSVTIPASVTNIGNSVFHGCEGLADSNGFVIVKNVLYDYYGAGADVIIPNNVMRIEDSAFSGCSSIERVMIPDSVKSIGEGAFSDCSSLAEVSLPDLSPDGLKGFNVEDVFYGTPFIKSTTFTDLVLSRSGRTLYGIKPRWYDVELGQEHRWEEVSKVRLIIPPTVEYVVGGIFGYLHFYRCNGEYEIGSTTTPLGPGSIVFEGNKPIAIENAFDFFISTDYKWQGLVYYYEGAKGWSWNGDWCGVKTYSLPNIPNEYKAASDCTFGRTYGGGWWTDELMSDGKLMQFTDYELWYNNDVGLYGNELAFFPVMTTESSIKPYVLIDDTPAAYLDEVEVWTDEQVRRRFIPTGVSVGDWEDDDECWEYEDDDEYWYWPKDLWPENRVVSGRKWIVVPVREVKEKWAGVSSFRVGVFGTSAISDPVLIVSDEDNAIFAKDFVSGFHGMTIEGVECLYEDGSANWDDTMITGYEFVNWSLPISFTITVPSAGTLVMGCKDDEDDSIAQAFSINGSGILSDRVTEMSDDWDDPNYKWGVTNFYKTGEADYVRRVKVSKGTTLTFTRNNLKDWECEFTRINFFPQESRSVAINVAYVCEEEMNGILGNEYWGRHYLKGYVKESGVYKKGETATFEAVSGEGEVFDHWVVCFGPLSLTESQRMSPRLSFVVTDEMCGDMADEAQIFLRAVWKPKYKITALPSIVGAGKIEGSGRYFVGDTVTLTATAASGCRFVKWSDGETSPTRTITVVPADVERVIFACFEAPNGVPNPTEWVVTFDANDGEVAESERSVKKDATIGALPTPTRSKYKFLGWYTAPEGGTKISATTKVTSDVTYYAQWVYDGSVTVSAYVAEGCEAMGKVTGGKTAKTGTKVTLTATVNKGYVFSHWEGPLSDEIDFRNPSITFVVGEKDVEFTAYFVPISDDTGDGDDFDVEDNISSEYVTKEAIKPISLSKFFEGAASFKVKGLPSGLKFTAKNIMKKGSKTEIEVPANSIYGTPTKSGVYTVTITVVFADKTTDTVDLPFIVRKDGEKIVLPVFDANYGKVKGGGVYAAGKKVTLKATANKGYVFAGWYEDEAFTTPCDSTIVDYRTASYYYTMGNTDKTFYARFVSVAEDTVLSLTVDGEDVPATFTVSEYAQLSLDVDSLSLPKISVKGLPSGMKFTAKPIYKKGSKTEIEVPANRIYGTPTKPGPNKVIVSISNQSIKKAIVKEFSIEVPNLTGANSYFVDNLDNGVGKKRVLSVGITNIDDIMPNLELRSPTAKLGVKGLPSGLKYNAKTGMITGIATKPGSYTVYLTVTEGKNKYVSTITVEVHALPDWAVGTFSAGDGWYYADVKGPTPWYGEAGYDFVFNLSVDSKGKLSGSLTVDVTAGKQEKATFSASGAVGFIESCHLEYWHDWQHGIGWRPECEYNGPAYYYDVDIKLHGVVQKRRLYICDASYGNRLEEGVPEPTVEGMGIAIFANAKLREGREDPEFLFEGTASMNLWNNKAYSGPLPKFASSTIKLQTISEGGSLCDLVIKQSGVVAITILKDNGVKDSASTDLEIYTINGDGSFHVIGNWIFQKGSASDIEMILRPNKNGIITANDIEIIDLDVDDDPNWDED